MHKSNIASVLLPFSACLTGQRWIAGCCLAVIALVGAIRIYEPMTGDVALFLTAAQKLHDGGVLYLDFWDVKQPGIFYFSLLAGKLFGFTAVGLHAFEVVYWMAVSFALVRLMWSEFEHPAIAAVVPMLMLSVHFANFPTWYMTQIEILANGPLLLSAACLVHANRSTTRAAHWSYAGGILAGLTLMLKLALAPIFAGFILALLATRMCGPMSDDWTSALRKLLPIMVWFACGAATIVAIVLLHSWWNGSLPKLIWTTLVLPGEVLKLQVLAPPSRFAVGFIFVLSHVAGFAVFALILVWLRPIADNARVWCALMLAWLVFGLIAITIQRWSWWGYHFSLLLGPSAMLAGLGLDRLLVWLDRVRGFDGRMRLTALTLLVAPLTIAMTANPTLRRAGDVASMLAGRPLDQVLRERNADYAMSAAAADVVAPIPIGLPIFVFGDPNIYMFLRARQAIAINGWGPQFTPPVQWKELERDLQRTKPPLIFIAGGFSRFLSESTPGLLTMLETEYREAGSATMGRWYRRQ